MGAATFDPYNDESWYFGRISLKDGIGLLMGERGSGVFLVGDSFSLPGNFLLYVRENFNICQYLIEPIRKERDTHWMMTRYRVRNYFFDDLPSLIAFFMKNELGSVPLVRPPSIRKLERVIAIYNFSSGDPEDLPFKRGEILTVIEKPEENWWMARNGLARVGSIPATYVKPLEEKACRSDGSPSPRTLSITSSDSVEVDSCAAKRNSWSQPKKVLYARVTKARTPSVYDTISLRLQIGDLIRLTRIHIGGLWEGELMSGGGKPRKKGYFPFICVELLDYNPVVAATKHKRKGSIYNFAAIQMMN